MLRIVIDKAFSDWYIKNANMNIDVFSDFLEFIKYLDNKLEVFTDMLIDDENSIHPLILNLINSNVPRISFFKTIVEVSSPEFFNDCPSYTMLFINISQEEAEIFIANYGVEVFTPTSFTKKWQYYITGRGRELVQSVGPKGFDSWNRLESFNHPFSSIIICDPYILSDEKKIRSNVRVLRGILNFFRNSIIAISDSDF